MSSTDPRSTPDRCPGALSTHQAADGTLARVRLPGGGLTPSQMQVLATAAADMGNGSIELTSRGNVQLRAVRDAAALADRLADIGLLPSPTHERVRNIVASPLSGRSSGVDKGLTDVRDLVGQLDRALCARQELAQLPGRTLFALDDGRGDVAALDPDFGVRAVSPHRYALLLAGADSGVRISSGDAVPTLIHAALSFLELRADEWRLSEMADGRARVTSALGLAAAAPEEFDEPQAVPPIGWLPQRDGRVALGGALALGLLDARLGEFLAAIDKPLVVTPWRSLLVCDLDEDAAETVVRVLAPMGLIFDADSPWIDASACVGSQGCDKAHADVRADLTDAVDAGTVAPGQRQHWSGCERRCGRPKGAVTDVIAGPTGYRVS